MQTISLEQLSDVHGGEVDYSHQRKWQAQRFLSGRANGFDAVRDGSKGLATQNGNFTPDVIPLFK